MSLNDLVSEFKQLPIEQQKDALKMLQDVMRESIRQASMDSLDGLLKDTPLATLSDEELKDMYIDYLVEKYS